MVPTTVPNPPEIAHIVLRHRSDRFLSYLPFLSIPACPAYSRVAFSFSCSFFLTLDYSEGLVSLRRTQPGGHTDSFHLIGLFVCLRAPQPICKTCDKYVQVTVSDLLCKKRHGMV
jgi:hypothetical protein